jgi:hypothetical protein
MDTYVTLSTYLSIKKNRDTFYPKIFAVCRGDATKASIVLDAYPNDELDDDIVQFLEAEIYIALAV